MSEDLQALVEKWRDRARVAFRDAEHEDGMRRRALEHGAMCYFNAAEELEAALTPRGLKLAEMVTLWPKVVE